MIRGVKVKLILIIVIAKLLYTEPLYSYSSFIFPSFFIILFFYINTLLK